MPLYEVLVINTHITKFTNVFDLVRTTARNVLLKGGTVRAIRYWGTRNLPQPMRSHKTWKTGGDYWTMHYDASPKLMKLVEDRLRSDPRVIRWTTIKLGEKLEDICDISSKTISANLVARSPAQTLSLKDKESLLIKD